FQCGCGRAHRRSLCLHPGEGVISGDRLDAPYSRRYAPLADDLEKADVAGACDMSAAAELARAANVEHTHLVAVFLAEQHHRAGFLRLVDRHHARVRWRICENLPVDDL